MHQPSAFVQTDNSELRALVKRYPLAVLIVEFEGELLINHIPLLWNSLPANEELHGHIPRNNELFAALSNSGGVLNATAVFRGPNGYISPADYPTKARTGKVVPTWNYAVVHLRGKLQLRDNPTFLRAQVDQLTAEHETYANPESVWTLDDAPQEFSSALLGSLVGIALCIEGVEGKYKLSQNRDAADRAGAANGVSRRGDPELATMMRKFAPD